MTSSTNAGPGGQAAMLVDVPETVYQTLLDERGRQDSSTQLELSIAIPPVLHAAFAAAVATTTTSARRSTHPDGFIGADVSKWAQGTIRLFTGEEIKVYDKDSDELLGVRLPEACFGFTLGSAPSATAASKGAPKAQHTVDVRVHRKYLPVSKCHGNAPFVFAFVLRPPGVAAAVVATSSFTCCSKAPSKGAPSSEARQPPKRIRARPSSKPVAAPPSETDVLVSKHFATGGAAVGASVAPEAVGSKRSRLAMEARAGRGDANNNNGDTDTESESPAADPRAQQGSKRPRPVPRGLARPQGSPKGASPDSFVTGVGNGVAAPLVPPLKPRSKQQGGGQASVVDANAPTTLAPASTSDAVLSMQSISSGVAMLSAAAESRLLLDHVDSRDMASSQRFETLFMPPQSDLQLQPTLSAELETLVTRHHRAPSLTAAAGRRPFSRSSGAARAGGPASSPTSFMLPLPGASPAAQAMVGGAIPMFDLLPSAALQLSRVMSTSSEAFRNGNAL